MSISIVGENYQITIPINIRKKYHIKKGDKIIVETTNTQKIFIRKPESILDESFGIWKDIGVGNSIKYVNTLRDKSEKRIKELNIE